MAVCRTLYRKIWDDPAVAPLNEDEWLSYIDRPLRYEGTSPQAFDGRRAANRVCAHEERGRRDAPWLAEAHLDQPGISMAAAAAAADQDGQEPFRAG